MISTNAFHNGRHSEPAVDDQPAHPGAGASPKALQRLLTAAWALLLLLGGIYLVAPLMDLRADLAGAIPADHVGAFQRVTGLTWQAATRATPGVAHYLTRLEVGYAVHELVFGILFLAIVAVPFRHRARWAWWACWAVLIANVSYSLTFGPYDSTVLSRSLVADVALPLLLLVQAPAFFSHRHAQP